MMGAIIGDIVGSVYEWNNIKTKDFPLFREECFCTDDTVMTCAVAEGILRGGREDDFIDAMKEMGRRYPFAGYGIRFFQWLTSESRSSYSSYGNGAAMRVSPCGWCGKQAGELALKATRVTHDHPEGIKGAFATAFAIHLCLNGADKAEVRSEIETNFGYDLSRTLDELRPDYSFNETCQETVPQAIIAFLESTGFEDAIRNAISLGGDSDTLAAITGSIAEAAYGIPRHIKEQAWGFLDETLQGICLRWWALHPPKLTDF